MKRSYLQYHHLKIGVNSPKTSLSTLKTKREFFVTCCVFGKNIDIFGDIIKICTFATG
jgi:hypothetical protein